MPFKLDLNEFDLPKAYLENIQTMLVFTQHDYVDKTAQKLHWVQQVRKIKVLRSNK